MYISDLPNIVSRKYAYADNLAIMHADDWQAVEGVLIKDVSTASEYLQICKLKLRTPNTGSAVLHPNSKEAKRELKAKKTTTKPCHSVPNPNTSE